MFISTFWKIKSTHVVCVYKFISVCIYSYVYVYIRVRIWYTGFFRIEGSSIPEIWVFSCDVINSYCVWPFPTPPAPPQHHPYLHLSSCPSSNPTPSLRLSLPSPATAFLIVPPFHPHLHRSNSPIVHAPIHAPVGHLPAPPSLVQHLEPIQGFKICSLRKTPIFFTWRYCKPLVFNFLWFLRWGWVFVERTQILSGI